MSGAASQLISGRKKRGDGGRRDGGGGRIANVDGRERKKVQEEGRNEGKQDRWVKGRGKLVRDDRGRER